MNHPLLHQPIPLGSLTLKNRLVLPPMATEKADKGQVPRPLWIIMEIWPRAGPVS